jgi:hypothetical protein
MAKDYFQEEPLFVEPLLFVPFKFAGRLSGPPAFTITRLQRMRMTILNVFPRRRKQLEIFVSIISRIVVDVMGYLLRIKKAAELLFHQISVLGKISLCRRMRMIGKIEIPITATQDYRFPFCLSRAFITAIKSGRFDVLGDELSTANPARPHQPLAAFSFPEFIAAFSAACLSILRRISKKHLSTFWTILPYHKMILSNNCLGVKVYAN